MKKYKIRATSEQLKNIGIDYSISNHVGELVYKYPTGYYKLRVKYYLNAENKQEYISTFDIPKTMLTEIK